MLFIFKVIFLISLSLAWGFYWVGLKNRRYNSQANLSLGISCILHLFNIIFIIFEFHAIENIWELLWIEIIILLIFIVVWLIWRSKLYVIGLVLPVILFILSIISGYNKNNLEVISTTSNKYFFELLFISHIILIVISYLLLFISLVCSTLFIYQNLRLKAFKPIKATFKIPIEKLLKYNYRFLLSSFAFLSLGIVTGLFVGALTIANNETAWLRLLMPFLLWLLQATTIVYSHISGIRGRIIAYLTFGISLLAVYSLIYEITQISIIK